MAMAMQGGGVTLAHSLWIQSGVEGKSRRQLSSSDWLSHIVTAGRKRRRHMFVLSVLSHFSSVRLQSPRNERYRLLLGWGFPISTPHRHVQRLVSSLILARPYQVDNITPLEVKLGNIFLILLSRLHLGSSSQNQKPSRIQALVRCACQCAS